MIKTTMQVLFHGIGHYTPTKVIGPSEWAHHDIILAYSGSVYMEAGGGHFHMDRGDVLVIPPHNPFVGRGVSDQSQIWVVHFKEYQSPFAGSQLVSRPQAWVVKAAFQDPFYLDCCRRFHELYKKVDAGESREHALRALRQLRIREAQRLLITTNLPIKEISSMVGYGDVVAFHRAFQRTGQTPAQYRAAHWSGV